MKKRNVKTLRLAKKSISNLAIHKLGGFRKERSDNGGASCLTCPSFATLCPQCPSGQVLCDI